MQAIGSDSEAPSSVIGGEHLTKRKECKQQFEMQEIEIGVLKQTSALVLGVGSNTKVKSYIHEIQNL